ncbi:MAG: PilZ domain-containing protein [Spirochaetaceae bacterium]|nr:MAG: PilZ domain-containing protein [Spirochaetaceae bacterium]
MATPTQTPQHTGPSAGTGAATGDAASAGDAARTGADGCTGADGNTEIAGRKIFFVHPPAWIREDLIYSMVKLGYKTYSTEESRGLRKLVSLYPGSLLFANVDKGPKGFDWLKILSSMNDLFREKDIRLGVLSEDNRKDAIKRYLSAVSAPCGYIVLTGGQKEIASRITTQTVRQKARGRRTQVRARCFDKNATVNVKYAGENHAGRVLDISGAGAACVIPSLDDRLRKDERMSDIQFKLNSRICTVSGKVVGIRTESEKTFVLLFDEARSDSVDEKIYAFVKETIQRNFERAMA